MEMKVKQLQLQVRLLASAFAIVLVAIGLGAATSDRTVKARLVVVEDANGKAIIALGAKDALGTLTTTADVFITPGSVVLRKEAKSGTIVSDDFLTIADGTASRAIHVSVRGIDLHNDKAKDVEEQLKTWP